MKLDSVLPKSRFEAKVWSMSETIKPVLLFVEDDYDLNYTFRDEFKKIAPQWGITSCREGWAAMQELTRGLEPQVLVVDVDMVGVGCRDLIEWVKEQSYFSSIPIVVLSNSDDFSHRQHCAALGVSSYLDKPGSLADLRELIHHVVKLCEESRFYAQDRNEISFA